MWSQELIKTSHVSPALSLRTLFRTGAVAEESLQYSPDSEQSYSLTPPHRQEESEDESSYVSHTQHLVEVMEERIKQKNLKKLEIKSTRSLVSGNSAGKKEVKSCSRLMMNTLISIFSSLSQWLGRSHPNQVGKTPSKVLNLIKKPWRHGNVVRTTIP